MRTIISVEHIHFFKGKDGKKHSRTYAILDDGTEATGYGHDFKEGDQVECFFHYETVKMKKSIIK